ncbi:SAM-dependent DNA methyltransferase, partial [Microtetraspora fusca]
LRRLLLKGPERHEQRPRSPNRANYFAEITSLKDSEEEFERNLHAEFVLALRTPSALTHFLKISGRYPLTGLGRLNTYAVFAETGRMILSSYGRVGMVLPTGIATDATTQFFFKNMVETKTLASLYDFENEEKLFINVHHSFRFCLWSGSGRRAPQQRINLAFRLRQVSQIAERRFVLTPADIIRLNPNTGTLPVFDYKRNADITIGIYRRVPVLWQESPDRNPWGLTLMQGVFNMASDSGLFRPSAAENETLQDMLDDGWEFDGNALVRNGERLLPLYEAKMLHHFDDRFGTYKGQTEAQANVGTVPRPTPEEKDDPAYSTISRYWVPEQAVEARLCPEEDLRARRILQWDHDWLLGWRDICRSSDTRTVISTALPRAAVGDKFLLALPQRDGALLQANLSSFVLDFCARQKISGTSLKYFIFKQLPVLPPSAYEVECPWDGDERLDDWVRARVLELTYTSYAMEPFARDHGDNGPPYRWDEERRFCLRAELDAAYFHLYGVARDDVEYIMDTFRAFRNVSPDLFARTKKAILEIYEAMAKAIADRTPYRSALTPSPGHGPRHPERRPDPSENDRG